MSTPHILSAEDIDRLARKRAGAKFGWYVHLTIYVLVNTGLFLGSSLMFGHGRYSLGPLLGWGIGVAFHGISVFVLGTGSAWRERMVQRERELIEASVRKP
ncbi:MAG: hypothetical protein RLZZ126_1792 [Pseudomonadota bacterium]|jgi:uncharacterized membrane protein